MIKFENVSKIYTDSKIKVKAVDNISLEIKDGDIFGIIGFSGAGKSTLIRMINRLEKPTTGKVFVDNSNVADLSGATLRKFRRNIGMIFQHFNLLENKTVFENISIPLELSKYSKKEIMKRTKELLEFVGLEGKDDSYPSMLSGGQKQRVGIARALAVKPSMLLCDEATSALDPQTTESVLALLQKVNKELGVTIVLITHQMNVIQKICDNVAVIADGKIVESGSVESVFENPKEEVTKGFVRTVINDKLPDSVIQFIKSYKKPQKVIRLKFEGKNADSPVMSDAIKETGAGISILCGIVTELKNKLVGFQTVQITGTKMQIKNALDYLEKRNVTGTEVNV